MTRDVRRAAGLLLVSLAAGPAARAADFYVDPAVGDPGNDGSAARPWRTLEEVIAGNLVETRTWDALPYSASSTLVPKNAGAPVKAGDTIWLRSGYHGELSVLRSYNADVVTIAAEPGQQPTLRRASFVASAGWILRGVSISPSYHASYTTVHLVEVSSHNFSGPAHDVVVEDCELFSVRDSSAWTLDDWNNLACDGVHVSGDDCTIRGNLLRNVDFGISVSGARALVERNVVENFAGDGLRGLGDHGTFQYNTVRNCYDVNQNHDDGFQSWSVGPGGVGTGEVVGITLRGNTFINYTDPAQPFRGTLQGIGCFDGFFVDWVVENNIVITDHWHGITLLGARDSRIVNNTVLDLNDTTPGPPWISIGLHKDGTPSSGCLVRNNLATALNIPAGQGVSEDHNLILGDPSAHFVDVAAHDLRLKPTSPARNAGSPLLAPAADHDGVPRPQEDVVDVGAHEYLPPGTDAGIVRDAAQAQDAQASSDAATAVDAAVAADAATPVEAGVDASAADGAAHRDAAASGDGAARPDAAVGGDGAAAADATQPDGAAHDRGVADATAVSDADRADGSGDDGADVGADRKGAAVVIASGCSCRGAGGASPWRGLVGLLAVLGAGRWRRGRGGA